MSAARSVGETAFHESSNAFGSRSAASAPSRRRSSQRTTQSLGGSPLMSTTRRTRGTWSRMARNFFRKPSSSTKTIVASLWLARYWICSGASVLFTVIAVPPAWSIARHDHAELALARAAGAKGQGQSADAIAVIGPGHRPPGAVRIRPLERLGVGVAGDTLGEYAADGPTADGLVDLRSLRDDVPVHDASSEPTPSSS